MTFTEFMERAAQAFEVFAVAVLIVGMVWSLLHSAWVWRTSGDGRRGYALLREFFGGVLLLGVEILVAADLIRTVAVTPSLESVGVLGMIVLIRTFLSFSLETEMEGVPPWRRAMATSGARVLSRAASRARGADAVDEPARTVRSGQSS
jgi:uncharacterized membrane protein